jgi:hypothetical protein
MRMHRFMGRVGIRGRRFVIAVALMAPLAGLTLASPALAVEKHPTGDFAVFKQCPTTAPGVLVCLYSQTLSGEVTLNKQTVPIEKPITLQGGIAVVDEKGDEAFVGASNGETLSKTPQKVPGGLLGLFKCNEISNIIERVACELVFENGVTGVNAVTELAKPASSIGISTSNLENREGTALSLPVKIHLENPFLGSECYVGSSSKPVTFNLTTGTTSPLAPNVPISGKVGKLHAKDEFEFIEITENTLVDNAFSAPEATGCGGVFSFLIDPLIDGKIGLPSADGHNTAIQNNTIKEGTTEGVIGSE